MRTANDDGPVPADVRIPYGEDPAQFGDLYLPESAGPHPVAVLIHGGYWRATYNLDHFSHAAAALRGQGLAVWNLESRRIGQAAGGWPGTFADVARGLDHLRQLATSYPLDLGRVVVTGFSAGGHLALWLAARWTPAGGPLRRPQPFAVRGVASLAGLCDLRRAWELRLSNGAVEQLLGGTPQAVPARYVAASPYELLPLGVPQVLIHGTADAAVPVELSERYYRRARALGDPVALVTLPNTGHFELIDPQSPAWPIVQEKLQRLGEAHGQALGGGLAT